MELENCKRCGRLFKKGICALCGTCYEYEQELHKEIYRFIQANKGISIEKLAEKFDIPQQEMETLLFSGALGTAVQLVTSQCAMCKCEMTFINRIGHFCYNCNQFVERSVVESKYPYESRYKAEIEMIRQSLSEKKADRSADLPSLKSKAENQGLGFRSKFRENR